MRTSWTWMAFLGWMALGQGLARAQEGVISGLVTEPGGAPVSGAQVTVLGDGIPLRRTVVSGGDGRYTVTQLPAGNFRVVAKKTDGVRRFFSSYYRPGASTFRFPEAARVLLQPNQTLNGIQIQMFLRSQFSGSLAGTVRRASDSGTVGVGVVQVRAAFADFEDVALLGPDGRYRMENLPPGNYFLVALASGYARQVYPEGLFLEEGIAITVPGPNLGGAIGGLDFSLQPGGSISGSVRRQSNFGVRAPRAQVAALNEEGRIVGLVRATDDQGDFRIDLLPFGSYRVAAWAPRDLQENLAPEFYQDALSFLSAEALELNADAVSVTGIDLTLPDGGVLTGTVRDGEGNPIVGAFVLAQPEENPLALDQSTVTDAGGVYRIEKLAAGRYLVQAGAAGQIREFYQDALLRNRALPVAVAAGATSSGIDFQLDAGRTLSGVVRRGSQPLDLARVVVRSDSLSFTRSAPSRPDGGYTLAGLPSAADYRVFAFAQNSAPRQVYPVDLRIADQTVDLTLEAGYQLGGRILNGSGVPIPNTVVELQHPQIPAPLSIRADATGQYGFKNLPSISGYQLSASAAGYARSAATGISLEGGDRLDFNLVLGPGRSISGRITRENQPLGGVRVTVHSTASGSSGSARSQQDGTYMISGLAAAPDFVLLAGRDALHTIPRTEPVNLTGGDATGIDIEIPAGRSVAGTVQANGSPVSAARVMAWSPTLQRGGAARTDLQGAFSIANLPPAEDYRLVAVQTGFTPQFYDHAATPETATLVDLRNGSAFGLDFDLEAGVSLSGTVRDAGGELLSDAFVAVVQGLDVLGTARTDAAGRFETTLVPAGTYTVVARAAGQPGRAVLPNVVVAGQPITGLSLAFGPSGSIEGRIDLATGSESVQRFAIVYRQDDRSFVQLARAAVDGTYRVVSLPAGDYLVGAAATGYLSEAYPNATTLATATTVTVVGGGNVTGIDFELEEAPGEKSDPLPNRILTGGLVISSCSVSPGVWTSTSKITVNWDELEGASGYNVSFDTAASGSVGTEATLESNVHSVTSETLADGIYYVHIQSYGLGTNPQTGLPENGVLVDESEAGPFLLDTTAPPSPDQLASSIDTGEISLSWINPFSDPGGSGLDLIQARRDDSVNPAGLEEGQLIHQNLSPEPGQAESTSDTTILDGQEYFYTVFAIDAAGNSSIPGAQISEASAPVGEDANPPQAPVSMGASVSPSHVMLRWKNPSSGDLQGVEIRHSSQNYPRAGQGQLLAKLEGDPGLVMSYFHQNPSNGPHYYSVFAYDAVPNFSTEPAQMFAFTEGALVPALQGFGWWLLALFAVARTAAGRRIRPWKRAPSGGSR